MKLLPFNPRNKEFESNLNWYRHQKYYTWKELSLASNVPCSTLIMLSNGMMSPFTKTGHIRNGIIPLCNILEVTFEDLFPRYSCKIKSDEVEIISLSECKSMSYEQVWDKQNNVIPHCFQIAKCADKFKYKLFINNVINNVSVDKLSKIHGLSTTSIRKKILSVKKIFICEYFKLTGIDIPKNVQHFIDNVKIETEKMRINKQKLEEIKKEKQRIRLENKLKKEKEKEEKQRIRLENKLKKEEERLIKQSIKENERHKKKIQKQRKLAAHKRRMKRVKELRHFWRLT